MKMNEVEKKQDKGVQEQFKYLTFRLGDEEYGLDVLKVKEIRGYEGETPIPNAPDFIKGVINLRGLIVPLLDMRIKFGLEKVEYTKYTVIIILSLEGRFSGILVDGVSEVITLTEDQIKPVPEIRSDKLREFLVGFGRKEKRTFVLLDIEKLVTSQELQLLDRSIPT